MCGSRLGGRGRGRRTKRGVFVSRCAVMTQYGRDVLCVEMQAVT